MSNYIPQFSGNPEDVDSFVNMILEDMSLENLAYYANNKFASDNVVTQSGYILPATSQGGVDGIAGIDTDLPMPIHIGQSWDRTLAQKVGDVIGSERRGAINSSNPNTLIFSALSDARPNPLNGRYYEGYSEDSYLTSNMVDATAYGVKGNDDFYLKANVDTKHFITYNAEWDRKTSSNYINVRSFYDYQLPSFAKAVKSGNVQGFMASFGSTNGIPNAVSPLIKDIADQSPYPLINFCDLQGDSDLFETLGNGYDATYASNAELTAALLIKSGVYGNNYDPTMIPEESYLNAITNNLLGLTRSDLETYVRPQIEIWVRSGYFNQSSYPYAAISADGQPMTSSDASHQEVALQAAQDGIVLLKNENNLLPLDKSKSILVSGMFADSRVQTWYSTATPAGINHTGITPVSALAELLQEDEGKVNYVPEITGDMIRIKSNATGKYIGINQGAVSAGATSAADAAHFQVYDWGRSAYSFLNLESDQFFSTDAERLTPENFIYYQQNGMPIPDIEMESRNPEVLPRVWTFEDKNGNKCLRYGAVESEVWQQLVSGIDFYKSFVEAGNYLSVKPDDSSLYLGNSTEVGPDETSYFAAEMIAEAGSGVDAYVSDNDYAVLFIGSDSHIYGSEMTDRQNLQIGKNQIKLVENVAASFPGKTIVVVKSDDPLNLEEIQNNENVGAILYMAYAGEFDSWAIAQTIFGDNLPSGKLTSAWLKDKTYLPQLQNTSEIDPNFTIDMKVADLADYKMTYMYNEAENVLYDFGYGLSYTSFQYTDMSINLLDSNTIVVSLTVKNTGNYSGREIVQVYAACESSSYGKYVPNKQLIAFEKTETIAAGESQKLEISITTDVLEKWNVISGKYFIESADYTIMIGSTSETIAYKKTVSISGEVLGELDLTDGISVWEKVFASSGTITEEVSKKRTAYREGNYFAVTSRQAGDFVAIPRVKLTDISSLELMVASGSDSSVIEIYKDALDGELLGTYTFNSTGSRTYYLDEASTFPVTEMDYIAITQDIEAEGVSDLYLRFNKAGIRIDTIKGV